jgi:hypothetical protein
MKRTLGKNVKRLLLVTLAILSLLQTEVYAATPEISFNRHEQDQAYWNWASTINSYIIANDDGTYTRVESMSSFITVETYTKDFKLKSKKKIKKELSNFGGFYAGKKYNYFVFGQSNTDEDDEKEVIRVVQYTKKWKRVQSASLYGANTYIPFKSGSLRMSEYGDTLMIRTCHQMYQTAHDGLRHQANMTICYNSKTGEIPFHYAGIFNISVAGYVSHSFNQFIQTDDDGTVLTVDHGDGAPRAIVLIRYENKGGEEAFKGSNEYVCIKRYPGDFGENYTGAEVGGFEISKNRYLVAYRYKEDIYLGSVSKEDFSDDSVKTKKYTKYSDGSKIKYTTPTLVKVNDNKFVLMWEVRDDGWYTGKIKYVVVDENGKKLTSVKTVKGLLSDCQPVVKGNTLVWYATSENPTFYKLNIKTGKLTTKTVE